MTTRGQIIAMGGGGFSMEPENLALDLYVLAQARSPRPRVAFVGTASGDSDSYLARFYAAFAALPCRATHLPLFRRTPDLRPFLLDQDVLYVGGGNVRSLIGTWRVWGLGEAIREAWQAGLVLAGVSAGANCWFEQCLTDSSAAAMTVAEGIGLLPGSVSPHYDGEAERRPAYQRFVADGTLADGWGIDDYAALHFKGQDLVRVVASRPGRAAWRVERRAGGCEETQHAAELLPLAAVGGARTDL